MGKTTIKASFSLHQKVLIKELECHGYVVAIMVEDAGVSYRVAYFHDGGRFYEWIYDWELT